MKKALLAALLELETDHQFLADLFAGIRAAKLPCEPHDPEDLSCHAVQCPDGTTCSRLMREQFHRSMYAVVGHFGREDRIIREVLLPAAFQTHTEQHADLSAQVQAAIIHFSESRNVRAARLELLAVAAAIEQHHRQQDNAFLQLLPGHARPAARQAPLAEPIHVSTMPPLPLTGDAVIDAEHHQLHNIIFRSQSLCCTGQTHCGDCHAATRQACSEQAVDLITDALKCMVEHFRREDALLREHVQNERIAAHLDSHAELSQRLSQLVGDYEDSNTAMCLYHLGEILQDWLHDHITRHDQPCFGRDATTATADTIPHLSTDMLEPGPGIALAFA